MRAETTKVACVFSLSFSRVEGHGEKPDRDCVELCGHQGLGIPAGILVALGLRLWDATTHRARSPAQTVVTA